LEESVYYIERLPVVVNPLEVALVGIVALAIVWISSLYPARVAAAMQPVDGLRQAER
jgi:lipoprotein-releasing system permease protein